MPHTEAYTIEVHGRSAGIVVAEETGFTFFAADARLHRLDRHRFRNVRQAERAAAAALRRAAA